jgi:NADPH-dependent 2,4-dienoyl-CoA reductase/sulfur reductase-like enzyme
MILVVGGGIAGQAVVEAIREHDALTPVTLACAEPRLPYDRVALSTLLAGGEELGSLRPASWYRGLPPARGPRRDRRRLPARARPARGRHRRRRLRHLPAPRPALRPAQRTRAQR